MGLSNSLVFRGESRPPQLDPSGVQVILFASCPACSFLDPIIMFLKGFIGTTCCGNRNNMPERMYTFV